MRQLTVALLVASCLSAEPPVRASIVVGGHAFDPAFFQIFDLPWLQAEVTPHPSALGTSVLNGDVIVLYDMLDELAPAKQAVLRRYAESGKGIVILHHALIDYTNWPWWHTEVAGGKYLRPGDGGKSSTFLHDIEIPVHVERQHPVTRGLADFTIHDEGYKGVWFSPRNTVLLSTTHAASDEPVCWISGWTKSRVVAIQLGHGPEAHRDPNYRKLVANAILWASGRTR
ncbi:MAG: ThuA domain-containing protein [Bryobacteraceae bacterium]